MQELLKIFMPPSNREVYDYQLSVEQLNKLLKYIATDDIVKLKYFKRMKRLWSIRRKIKHCVKVINRFKNLYKLHDLSVFKMPFSGGRTSDVNIVVYKWMTISKYSSMSFNDFLDMSYILTEECLYFIAHDKRADVVTKYNLTAPSKEFAQEINKKPSRILDDFGKALKAKKISEELKARRKVG